MKKINLGFIGAGTRNRVYARNLNKQYKNRIHISAVCDINEPTACDFKALYGEEDTRVYTDYRKLLEEGDTIDGFLIAPPNHLHEKIAVPFLQKGKHMLLEKPLAHTHESCMNIAVAYTRSSSRVTMGFVLRYTPFYRAIMGMLKENRIGRVKVLSADEVVGPVLSSLFFRTWRGKREYTGGLLLEKCCHDLDLINEMLGVNPLRVSAFAGINHFGPRQGCGPRCAVCELKDTCAFSTVLWEKTVSPGEDNGEYEYVDFTNDLCVYNDEHNFVDSQSQLIEYEGNILVYFNVTLGGIETRRTIDIIGTEGRIQGDFRENRIVCFTSGVAEPEEIKIEHEGSGHGGGDSVLTRSFMESLDNPHYVPEASFKDGLKSALLAFLCDRARDEERVVPVSYMDELGSIRE